MSGRVIKMARHDNTFCVEERNIFNDSQLLRIYLVKIVAEVLWMLHKLQFLGGWWNWYTRRFQVPVTQVVRVQVSHRPPYLRKTNAFFPCTFFIKTISAILRCFWCAEFVNVLHSALHLGSRAARCAGSSSFRSTNRSL